MSPDPGNTHDSKSKSPKPNKLAGEKSPYLLQHAYNPVDWYPWGKEAITRAKRENKPIFLSIGYSSCHWCHVMEKESFEDDDIAGLLNGNFICIKVDREERPDLDEIYMKAVMTLTGSGGWPLTVFLTQNLVPFYGGTYFPPASRNGVLGLMTLLRRISDIWRSDRASIDKSAFQIRMALDEIYDARADAGEILDDHVLDDCYGILSQEYDQQYGGFGTAPKFPTPSNLLFLLRYQAKTREIAPLRMVTKTLDFMASGGIYDHVGGGFHRYATDREWIVPHFEKMLYDNALLAIAYTEAYQLTRKESYRTVVQEILSWVLSEMTSISGGFYSAQDADSTEGEGAYYTWSPLDLERALMDSECDMGQLDTHLDAISEYFLITSKGNFDRGKTILTTRFARSRSTLEDASPDLDMTIEKAKNAMRKFRKKRPKPLTDDKIITGWNGLMISAMSRAYRVFGNNSFLEASKKAADFILCNMTEHAAGSTTLFRRFCAGEPKEKGVLEDYALFINGLIDLYEAIFEPRYLEQALTFCDEMIKDFYDIDNWGFFLTTQSSEDLIVRPKETYDGAIPSGNSAALFVLIRLAEMSSKDVYRNKAKETFRTFWKVLTNNPSSHTFMLVALDFMLGNPREIVLSGDRDSKSFKELINVLYQQYLPNSVIVLADSRIENLAPIVKGRILELGQPAKAYVCSNNTCKLPSATSVELLSSLGS